MGAHHFKLQLVPREYFEARGATIPAVLTDDEIAGGEDLSTGWWAARQPSEQALARLRQICPKHKSWGETEEYVTGDRGSDLRIWWEAGRIWSVGFRFSPGADDRRLLDEFVAIAGDEKCLLWDEQTRSLFEPLPEVVTDRLRTSRAMRFVSDPRHAIVETARVRDFELVPMASLGEEHFAKHPMWSELYDFEERDEIASWGVDRQWLDEQIRLRDIGNDHWAYPVLVPQPLPDRMRIYIAARFTTPSGHQLSGYVVNDDAYYIALFVAGKEYEFSIHLADSCHESLDRLQQAVPGIGVVFPLQYHTDFCDEEGRPIQGTFQLPPLKG